MARSYPNQFDLGAFLPTTDIFDVSRIASIEVGSPEFKEFLVRMRQSINDVALVVNIKDSGYYYPQEFVNGQVFFPNPSLNSTTSQAPIPRQVFRKVINFGALPDTASTSVPHELTIDANFSFTRIYGCATNPSTSFIPIPYVTITASADNIQLDVDSTFVTITTESDRSAYTTCYVILEYIKQ